MSEIGHEDSVSYFWMKIVGNLDIFFNSIYSNHVVSLGPKVKHVARTHATARIQPVFAGGQPCEMLQRVPVVPERRMGASDIH